MYSIFHKDNSAPAMARSKIPPLTLAVFAVKIEFMSFKEVK